jgi:tripeptide aminopeptidase
MIDFVNRLVDLAIQIQQMPAPTFYEGVCAKFVRDLFNKDGLHDVSTGPEGNVYARLAGQGGSSPVVVSAHLDTVCSNGTVLEVRSAVDKVSGPGIGDNSLGVAALLGLV